MGAPPAASLDHAGHLRAPPTTNSNTPKAKCCPRSAATKSTQETYYGNARVLWPVLHHVCGFSALRHSHLCHSRPNSNAIFSSLTNSTWRHPSVRQRNPVPLQCVLYSGASSKRDANGAFDAIPKRLQEGSTTQLLPRLPASWRMPSCTGRAAPSIRPRGKLCIHHLGT